MKILHSSTINDPDFLSIIYPEQHVNLPFGRFITGVEDLIAIGEVMHNCLVQRSNIEKYTRNILRHRWNLYYFVDGSETCLFSVNKNLKVLEIESPPLIPYNLASDNHSFFNQQTPENILCSIVHKKIKDMQTLIKQSKKIYPKLSSRDQLLYIYAYGHLIKMLPVDYNIFSTKSLRQLPIAIAEKIISHVMFGLTGPNVKAKTYDRVYKSLSEFSTR